MENNVKRGGISVQTEHIFPVIKKWLYSEKDIFLREIVSNASDAVTKLRRLASLGQYDGGDETYRVGAGELIFYPASVPHSIVDTDGRNWEVSFVTFECDSPIISTLANRVFVPDKGISDRINSIFRFGVTKADRYAPLGRDSPPSHRNPAVDQQAQREDEGHRAHRHGGGEVTVEGGHVPQQLGFPVAGQHGGHGGRQTESGAQE